MMGARLGKKMSVLAGIVSALVASSLSGCNGQKGDFGLLAALTVPSSTVAPRGGGSSSGDGALDCGNLDPDKVYIFGRLHRTDSTALAIADPLDPTNYCVGFDGDIRYGLVSEDGRFIYNPRSTATKSFYMMTHDPLEKSSDVWVYPVGARENDALLLEETNSSCTLIYNTHVNQATGDIFYNCDAAIHREGERYVTSGVLLAVFDDGSLLTWVKSTSADDHLQLVYPDLTTATITLPASTADASAFGFLSSKLFIDQSSADQRAWLAVEYVDSSFQAHQKRWQVDPVALTAVDEGGFAAFPADVENTGGASRMDGEGNLWHATDNWVIVKRPIDSSGISATVVYSLDDPRYTDDYWKQTDHHFVRMELHSGALFTGM